MLLCWNLSLLRPVLSHKVKQNSSFSSSLPPLLVVPVDLTLASLTAQPLASAPPLWEVVPRPGDIPVPPAWPRSWAGSCWQPPGGFGASPRSSEPSLCLSGFPTARQTRPTIKCLPTLPRTSSMRTWSATPSSAPSGKWSVQRNRRGWTRGGGGREGLQG